MYVYIFYIDKLNPKNYAILLTLLLLLVRLVLSSIPNKNVCK